MPDLVHAVLSNPALQSAIAFATCLFLLALVARAGVRTLFSGKTPNEDCGHLEGCDISTTAVMSSEQAKVFRMLLPFAAKRDLHLLAEVSLSAIFTVKHGSDRKKAFAGFGSVRQKRVDLLLIDARQRPVCGVEYHGSGHWSANAKRRDHVKRTAFQMAGLPLVEVSKGEDLTDLAGRIEAAIGSTGQAVSSAENRQRKISMRRAA